MPAAQNIMMEALCQAPRKGQATPQLVADGPGLRRTATRGISGNFTSSARNSTCSPPLLRHDNQLAFLRLDTSFMVFIRTDMAGNLAKALYETGVTWKECYANPS